MTRRRVRIDIDEAARSGVGHAARVRSGRRQHRQRPGAITLQLLLQRFHRGEWLDVAQALDPFHAAPTRRTDRHRNRRGGPRASACHPGRWDGRPDSSCRRPARPAIRRARRRLRRAAAASAAGSSPRLMVGTPICRPRRSPFHHSPAHPVGPAEHAGRTGEIAAGHGAADPGARHVLLAEVHRRHHVHLEPVRARRAAGGSRRRRCVRGRTRDRARSPAPSSGTDRAGCPGRTPPG